jgi:hypothetical protein
VLRTHAQKRKEQKIPERGVWMLNKVLGEELSKKDPAAQSE